MSLVLMILIFSWRDIQTQKRIHNHLSGSDVYTMKNIHEDKGIVLEMGEVKRSFSEELIFEQNEVRK